MTGRPYSLAAKLATLDVGQVMYLPDDAPLMRATQMERQITSLVSRSPRLKGRKFMTARSDCITAGRRHEHVLRVERMECQRNGDQGYPNTAGTC